MTYIVAFIVGAVTDVIWTLYIYNVSAQNRLMSANYSVLTGVCSLTLIKYISQDEYAFLVWISGLWLGTYYARSIEAVFYKIFKI